jgi:hypothetical protein
MVKLALTVISIFLFINCGYTQRERHKFWIYQEKTPKMGIEELLKKDIRNMGFNDSLHCEVRWALFYFSVDYKGKIKSLEVDGRGKLDSNTVSKIKQNIYATQGFWHIPKGTLKHEVCKFVYPFFRYDLDNTQCLETQIQVKRETLKFMRLFFKLKADLEEDKGNVYVISPRNDVPGQL